MDIERLYRDYGIPTASENHKHYRDGWVNCECPFCTGNPGFHLGYNIDNDFFVCWRCDLGYSKKRILSTILGVSESEIHIILQKYRTLRNRKENSVKSQNKQLVKPKFLQPLQKIHKIYLKNRGFDPEKLQELYKLQATDVLSKVQINEYKVLSYAYRIYIPVFWNGVEVTYQARDYTGKQAKKYLACPETAEVINIKQVLYGTQAVWERRFGIGVEGVTDVWRMGENAVGLFGIKYRVEQVRLIAEHFENFVVFFDPEPQAQKQAAKLVADLRFRGVNAISYQNLKCDPAELSQKEADELVKKLKKLVLP